MKATYRINCTQLGSDSIGDLQAMTDCARPISYDSFRREVSGADLDMLADQFGYVKDPQRGGLSLRRDRMVEFFRSVYKGKPCFYMRHSAIEYIFYATFNGLGAELYAYRNVGPHTAKLAEAILCRKKLSGKLKEAARLELSAAVENDNLGPGDVRYCHNLAKRIERNEA